MQVFYPPIVVGDVADEIVWSITSWCLRHGSNKSGDELDVPQYGIRPNMWVVSGKWHPLITNLNGYISQHRVEDVLHFAGDDFNSAIEEHATGPLTTEQALRIRQLVRENSEVGGS
jgi:hypothetical protein